MPLTFVNDADYHLIGYVFSLWKLFRELTSKFDRSGDVVETVGLDAVLKGDAEAQIKLRVTNASGQTKDISVAHTMSGDQIKCKFSRYSSLWLRLSSQG